jgi:WD40 repeat protein
VATVSEGDIARVWRADGTDRNDPVELVGHEGRVLATEFGPDGERVVTASSDATARVWRTDGTDREDPVVLVGHDGPVVSAAVSPDGERVVTASEDGIARVWVLLSSAPADLLRSPEWPALLRYLGQATAMTKACLTVDDRMRLLLESADDASDEYKRCVERNRD